MFYNQQRFFSYCQNGTISYSIKSPHLVSPKIIEKYSNFSNVEKLFQRPNVLPSFHIYTVWPDDKIAAEIPQRDIMTDGSYNENYQSGVRRTLSFRLNNQHDKYLPSINTIWANSKIYFERGVRIPGDDIEITFPSGIFYVTSVSVTNTQTEKSVSVECSDKFSILDSPVGTVQDSVEIEVGEKAMEVIKNILSTPLKNGYCLDTKRIFFDPKFQDVELQQTIKLQSGSTYGKLLLEIADMFSAEVFYDEMGYLNFIPMVQETREYNKPILSAYYNDSPFVSGDNIKLDFNSFVNAITVVGNNVNGHTCRASSSNQNPKSPISVGRIGERWGSIVNDPNITNDISAQERADYELRKAMVYQSETSCSIAFNPLLKANSLVKFTNEHLKFIEETFLVQSINSPINYSGTMNASIVNLKDLPFTF